MKKLLSLAFICVAFIAFPALAEEPKPMDSAPKLHSHLALYDAKLVVGQTNIPLKSVSGKLVIKTTVGCKDYTTDTRMGLLLAPADGSKLIDFRQKETINETKDGLHLKASGQTTKDAKDISSYAVEATFANQLSAGQASFTLPMAQTLSLPQGTLFPHAATIKLMSLAATGKPHLSSQAFTPQIPNSLISRIESEIGAPKATNLTTAIEGTPLPKEMYLWPIKTQSFNSPETSPSPQSYDETAMWMAPMGLSTQIVRNVEGVKVLFTLIKYQEFIPAYCPKGTIIR